MKMFESLRAVKSARGALFMGTLAAVAAACSREEPPAPEPRIVRTVVVERAAEGGVTRYTAEIRSRYESDLSFQVGGKIVSRAVDAGTFVKKGTVLAKLDQTDQRTGVDAARAAVNAVRAELDRARTEEARYRDLLERGLTTRAAYLAQQTAVKTGQSQLEQANAELELNEQRLAYTTLRADDDGIVTRLYAEVGAVVGAGQRVLSIARPDELEAVFDVPDGRMHEIRGATQVNVELLDGTPATHAAAIREIAPTADPATRTYQVKATIAAPPAGLRLGTSVTVTVPHAGGRGSIALPATALFQKDAGPALWVVRDDLTLELRSVTVERYESSEVLVASGLAMGDRVVTAGVHRLADGERVRVLGGDHE
jgi:RND family efflux transporter MFP subunit